MLNSLLISFIINENYFWCFITNYINKFILEYYVLIIINNITIWKILFIKNMVDQPKYVLTVFTKMVYSTRESMMNKSANKK